MPLKTRVQGLRQTETNSTNSSAAPTRFEVQPQDATPHHGPSHAPHSAQGVMMKSQAARTALQPRSVHDVHAMPRESFCVSYCWEQAKWKRWMELPRRRVRKQDAWTAADNYEFQIKSVFLLWDADPCSGWRDLRMIFHFS